MSQLTAKMENWARKGVIGLSAVALCLAPMVSPAAARAKVGVASAVIPQARLGDTLDDLEIISVGDRVDQDVLIETGKRGRTQVLFVDGSSMNIGPSSRIVIDAFVFDPAQLSGNLGARIEKGSMRFIGGVLSKRANQVKFNAGEATVGIRGGIAKIALGGDGKLKAELVHGRLSVTTPEGIFETDRIGTLIERDVEGDVVTRSVTVEEAKEELDEEAKENIVEPQAEEPDTTAAGDDTSPSTEDVANDDAATQEAEAGDTPLDAGAADAGEPVNDDEAAAIDETTATPAAADEPADAAALGAGEEKVTGDVLVDDPVDSGLVQIGADGKLEATAELAEIDPDAAKLINEGGVAVDDSGQIVPTAKMLELDPTAQAMFDEGLLEVDENGFLVPSQDYDPDGFYEDVSFQETEDKQVSEATLKEFGFEEVQVLNDEDIFKSNLSATRAVLEADETTAKLYEVGQLEIDENGLLKPSADFDPLLAARAEQAVEREQITFVDDSAADKLLLNTGVFDTKITTRVVGTDLASDLYSAEVTQVVSADIVRDDALNAITKLAAANGLSLPDNIDEKELDDLVALGGALSTRDALKASVGITSVDYNEPIAEVDVGEDGKVVLRTVGVDGKVEETDAESALIDLVTGSIDIETASKFVSEEELVRLLPSFDTQNDDTKKDDASGLSDIAAKDDDGGSTQSNIESRLIAAIEANDGKLPSVDDAGGLATISIIDAAKGEDLVLDPTAEAGSIDTGNFDDKTVFVPEIDPQVKVDDIIDLGKTNFVGGLSDEFVKEAATRSPSIEILDPISLIADETGDLAKVTFVEDDKSEPDYDTKDDLVTRQIEDEKNEQAEKIAAEQANTVIESAVISLAGQRLAKNSVWGSGSALYWTAYSSAGLETDDNEPSPQNELRLLGDGQMTLGLAKLYNDDDDSGVINGLGTPIVAMGEATALLAAHNVTFKNTVDAVLLSRTSTNTVSQNFVSNRPEVLQARSPVEICSCDQVATGLWTTEDFTDRALGNLSYQHQSHWAIGAPLSSDTIRSLAGMMASFEGHAYGTVANAAGVKEGFGEVVVGLDFANPNDMSRNVFALENFDAANLNEPISVSVPLTQGRDANGVFDGRYVGRGGNVRIDGGVHGTVDNLQTAGTFALNAPGDLAISGSYAARGTAVESVTEPSSVTIVSRTR